VGLPGSKGVRTVFALWRRQFGLGVSRRVPLARTPPVFSRGYYLELSPGIEGGILERFVDFWEVVEWGLGFSYNSGFSILQFLQFLQFFRFWSANAAPRSTLQSSVPPGPGR